MLYHDRTRLWKIKMLEQLQHIKLSVYFVRNACTFSVLSGIICPHYYAQGTPCSLLLTDCICSPS
jgi:hypothetical protein